MGTIKKTTCHYCEGFGCENCLYSGVLQTLEASNTRRSVAVNFKKKYPPAIKKQFSRNDEDFQTPVAVCEYMASFLPADAGHILEPTPGKGNLVKALESKGRVMVPHNFDQILTPYFDWIVMNPPFTPMARGYEILYRCMEMSDNIVALMPYLTIINSQKRTDDIMRFGLKSITHLPRSVFQGSRVQTCILEMQKGFIGETIFRTYK